MKSARLIAVASGGGHWEQLMTMRSAFADYDVYYVTTMAGLPEQVGSGRHAIIQDCNKNQPLRALLCFAQAVVLLLKFRPHVVITTGAFPGLIILVASRLVGAKSVWIDSIANAEEMSASGKLARPFADRWLSQWEHVAQKSGAQYIGETL